MSSAFITAHAAISSHGITNNDDLLLYNTAKLPRDEWFKKIYEHIGMDYPRFFRTDALCRMGLLLTELLSRTVPFERHYQPADVALVFANSSSSLDTDEHFQQTIADDRQFFPSPAVFVYTLPNIVMGEVAIRHRLNGENLFLINRSFNADEICTAAQLLTGNQKAGCCITGWLEVHGNQVEGLLCCVEKKQSEISNLPFDNFHLEQLFNNTLK